MCTHPLSPIDRHTQSQGRIIGDLCAHTPTTHRYIHRERLLGSYVQIPQHLQVRTVTGTLGATQEKMHTEEGKVYSLMYTLLK